MNPFQVSIPPKQVFKEPATAYRKMLDDYYIRMNAEFFNIVSNDVEQRAKREGRIPETLVTFRGNQAVTNLIQFMKNRTGGVSAIYTDNRYLLDVVNEVHQALIIESKRVTGNTSQQFKAFVTERKTGWNKSSATRWREIPLPATDGIISTLPAKPVFWVGGPFVPHAHKFMYLNRLDIKSTRRSKDAKLLKKDPKAKVRATLYHRVIKKINRRYSAKGSDPSKSSIIMSEVALPNFPNQNPKYKTPVTRLVGIAIRVLSTSEGARFAYDMAKGGKPVLVDLGSIPNVQ